MSHQVIRILVTAKSEEEALDIAKRTINDNLCREGGYFDYGTFFDDNKSTISGKARWGNRVPVADVNSKEGKQLLDEGMKFTINNCKEALKEIRNFLNKYTDDEIVEEKSNPDLSKQVIDALDGTENDRISLCRYNFYQVGMYGGSGIYVYDSDGSAIRNYGELDWFMKYYKERGDKVFIVPVDVHS